MTTMFNKKTETMSIKEFMNMKKEVLSIEETEIMRKGKVAGYSLGFSLLPLALTPLTQTTTASAEAVVTVVSNADMQTRMITAFDPLIDLIQALAFPVAMVVVLGGAIMVMINQKEKGFGMMQTAGLGYVLVQMAPMILKILVDAMKVAV